MNGEPYVTMEMIGKTTNRLPYGLSEFKQAIGYIKTCWDNGRDLKPSHRMNALGGTSAMTGDGIFIFQSDSLNAEFLFVKLNSGAGFFGGQKASYASFVNTGGLAVRTDDWTAGAVFRSFETALTSLENAFKEAESRPKIPPLSDAMNRAADETVRWCLSQISNFVGADVEACPKYDNHHDERIAAYARGFLSGYLQVNRVDQVWARGDQSVEMAGYIALSAAVLAGIFGPDVDRILRVAPMLTETSHDDLKLMDGVGGTDGMAHATGREKQYGGGLLHYLKRNVGSRY